MNNFEFPLWQVFEADVRVCIAAVSPGTFLLAYAPSSVGGYTYYAGKQEFSTHVLQVLCTTDLNCLLMLGYSKQTLTHSLPPSPPPFCIAINGKCKFLLRLNLQLFINCVLLLDANNDLMPHKYLSTYLPIHKIQ